MKVSKKAYYGLRAVLALAVIKKPLSIHALAELEHLPEDYLEKILQALRRKEIVVAQKGASGGYTLAHSPEDLTLWDIVSALDGPLKTFEPPIVKHGSLPCPQVSHCQSNEVWRILEESIENTLSKITLRKMIPKA